MLIFSERRLGRKIAKAWSMGARPHARCPKCGVDCGTGDALTGHLARAHQWRLMSAAERAADGVAQAVEAT